MPNIKAKSPSDNKLRDYTALIQMANLLLIKALKIKVKAWKCSGEVGACFALFLI